MDKFLTFCTCLFSLGFHAQVESSNEHTKGEVMLGYTVSTLPINQHQITVDYFLHENWSLVYRAGMTIDRMGVSSSDYNIPLGATVAAGMISVSACGTCSGYCALDDGFELFTYSLMIPDGVSYHMYPMTNLTVSPYFIFSGIGIHQDDEGSEFFYSPSGGMRFSYAPGGMALSLLADAQMKRNFYGEAIPFVNFGLAVSF